MVSFFFNNVNLTETVGVQAIEIYSYYDTSLNQITGPVFLGG